MEKKIRQREEIMGKKVIFGKDYSENEYAKIFFYLCIGGSAAIAEWIMFYFFDGFYAAFFDNSALRISVSTATAFSLATVYHYILGNILVFESGRRYDRKKELTLVFVVSIIGLLWNLLLMWIFTSGLSIEPVPAKIIASAVVTVWNYLSRKKWIF